MNLWESGPRVVKTPAKLYFNADRLRSIPGSISFSSDLLGAFLASRDRPPQLQRFDGFAIMPNTQPQNAKSSARRLIVGKRVLLRKTGSLRMNPFCEAKFC
jgi:hypothetical protein